jgi:hypothetical protein
MKRTALVLLILGLAIQAHAQADDTEKLLDATRVDREIVLSMVGQEVRFSADGGRRSGVIGTSRTFAGTDGLIVLFHNFNPLAMSITATEAKTAEPVTKGQAGFLDALTSTLKGLGGAAPGTDRPLENPAATCANANQHVAASVTAMENVESTVLDANLRAKWVAEAVGRDGVRAAKDEIDVFAAGLEQKIAKLKEKQQGLADIVNTAQNFRKDIGEINTKLKSLNENLLAVTESIAESKKHKKSTTAETAELSRLHKQKFSLAADLARKEAELACWPEASELRRRVKTVLIHSQKLSDSLKTLIVSLALYANDTNWSGSNAADYILLQTETEPDVLNTITIKITPLSLTENGVLEAKSSPLSRDIVLREYRRLVPEFGVAVVYNDLQYPKYVSKDGKVAANGFDSSNVNAAMTMNLLCNCFGGHFVYPGVQLGVSKVKDYPGLMGGVAFRFAGLKRMVFSAGRMVTWYKDLNKLKISDPASDNDIKADLKLRRAPTAFYLAAQFTF